MNLPDTTAGRRTFLTRGEWMTLFGMVLCVVSPALTWTYEPPKTVTAFAAVYVARYTRGRFDRPGFDVRMGPVSVGWVVVVCAVVCAALLLLNPGAKERRLYLALQVALGLLVLALAVAHLGAYGGIVLAILGGVLLIAGGVFRYGGAEQAQPPD